MANAIQYKRLTLPGRALPNSGLKQTDLAALDPRSLGLVRWADQMHGVPDDLPVEAFVGTEFNQLGLGRFDVQLHASGAGSIFIEGRWELRDPEGKVVDELREHSERDAFRIHRILDVRIVGAAVNPPRSFVLTFENGWTLAVFDDSPQYESFSIHLHGRPSLHV